MSMLVCSVDLLILKAPFTTAADDILNHFSVYIVKPVISKQLWGSQKVVA